MTARNITRANIMYLLQYGRIAKQGINPILINKEKLQRYYLSHYGNKKAHGKRSLTSISIGIFLLLILFFKTFGG